ncbi:MAG: SAM-dependent methyltransferase [Albidovulum sp.]|nr:SAM-dependent methyltransferase [Albidovulum sp.]
MTELLDVLKRRIRAGGPIPVSEYMSACLLHPQFGFYCRKDPFGSAGSFTTAPEISQMFGEIVGMFLAQVWLDQNSPGEFTLAELGPGRGTLMADLLRSARVVPGFREAAKVVLVEHSPELKKRQLSSLDERNIDWVNFSCDLPDKPLYLIANEFFDALPVRQYVKRQSAIEEIRVGLDNGRLVPGISRLAPEAPDTRDSDIAGSEIVELRPSAEAVLRPICEKISEFGGVALIVDYGDWEIRGSTLQAVHRHGRVDPFSSPGCADISAHVDFKSLSGLAGEAAVTEMTTQGEFLLRLGIRERARKLSKNLKGRALEEHAAAFERLTSPEQMGSLFKAVAFYSRHFPLPPGFSK